MDTTTDAATVESYVEMVKQLDQKSVLYGLIVLVVGIVIAHLLVRAIDKTLTKYKLIPDTLHSILKTVFRILLDLIVVMIAASIMGIPITSFVAVFSVLGLAVSLSVQNMLTNLVGGINILVGKPFEVGHYIETPDFAGTVKEIGIMHTRLTTYDGKWIYVPNSQMYSSRVVNYTQSEQRRVDLTFTASYDNDPAQVMAVLRQVIDSIPEALQDPEPKVHVDSYGDSAISYVVWVWCKAGDFFTVKYALNERMYAAFAKAGVQMTYPHLNVHMMSK